MNTSRATTRYLTTKQVAQALGVSDASLKRWCDKGLIQCARTGGGHRRVALASVVDFLRKQGFPLLYPELLGFPARAQGQISDPQAASAEIRRTLAAGEEEAFREILFQLYLSGMPLVEICDRQLAPAFEELGRQWYANELQVYQERRACEICLRWLHEVRLTLPPAAADAPLALGGTPARDPYQIANTMAELVLAEAGWHVMALGTNLPGGTLATAVRDHSPRIVWISASYVEYEPDFISDFAEVHAATQRAGGRLVAGGRALTQRLRGALPAYAHGETFTWLAQTARGWLPASA